MYIQAYSYMIRYRKHIVKLILYREIWRNGEQ